MYEWKLINIGFPLWTILTPTHALHLEDDLYTGWRLYSRNLLTDTITEIAFFRLKGVDQSFPRSSVDQRCWIEPEVLPRAITLLTDLGYIKE